MQAVAAEFLGCAAKFYCFQERRVLAKPKSEVGLNAQKWRGDLPHICRFNFGNWAKHLVSIHYFKICS